MADSPPVKGSEKDVSNRVDKSHPHTSQFKHILTLSLIDPDPLHPPAPGEIGGLI